ncbi:MAG: glutamine--fructose-6-phosphate transaminase (isomerizing) [Kiritimatiellia bacterium]|nr:glutamine--fructose-6-phosphate transaminase (isomerizing) [Kiritimatiellia bacterium]
MCGIVGFTSRTASAVGPLVNGLRRLEYRGYDSAGVALEGADGLRVYKQTGKVAELDKLLKGALKTEEEQAKYTIGIAHTRWATHGLPTRANAHPHVADDGNLALVHNGIIENYAALRTGLEKRGCTFLSQTDTEVLAHLVATFDRGDFLSAVSQALKQVEGTYGIATISAKHLGEMIVARKGSPLVIGLGEDETVVASDVSAIVAYTRQVVYLKDGDIARVTPEGVQIYSLDNAPVSREVQEVDWDLGAIEKGGFDHFMLKEIFEQPDALRNTIRGRLDKQGATAVLAGLNLSPRDLAAIRRLVIIGCGTSLHAGMVGKYLFESLADLPTSPEQAAEFRYSNPIVGPDDWAIALSQSGETADTLAAVRESIRKGALVSGLCNVVGSTIAREAGRGVYLHAGPEISVASTKAFTAQVTALLMMALKMGRTRRLSHEEGARLVNEIERIPELVAEVVKQNDAIAEIAEKYAQAKDMFFIGRGSLYPTALEGALKIKEVAYVHAEGYQAAELKHGPIALLSEQTPVVALLADVPGKEKTVGNVQECRARQAPVLGIVTEGDTDAAAHVNDAIFIPRTSPEIAPIVTVVALQLFAYHVARLRGCEIDQPRNLAKSVTVE